MAEKPTQHYRLTTDKARVLGVVESSVERRSGAWKGLSGRETAGRNFGMGLAPLEGGGSYRRSLKVHITGTDDKRSETLSGWGQRIRFYGFRLSSVRCCNSVPHVALRQTAQGGAIGNPTSSWWLRVLTDCTCLFGRHERSPYESQPLQLWTNVVVGIVGGGTAATQLLRWIGRHGGRGHSIAAALKGSEGVIHEGPRGLALRRKEERESKLHSSPPRKNQKWISPSPYGGRLRGTGVRALSRPRGCLSCQNFLNSVATLRSTRIMVYMTLEHLPTVRILSTFVKSLNLTKTRLKALSGQTSNTCMILRLFVCEKLARKSLNGADQPIPYRVDVCATCMGRLVHP